MAIKFDKTKPHGVIRGVQTGAVKLAFYQNGHYFDAKGEYVDLNPAPVKEPEAPVIPVNEPEPEVPVVVEEPVAAVKEPEPKAKAKAEKTKVQLPPGLPTKE